MLPVSAAGPSSYNMQRSTQGAFAKWVSLVFRYLDGHLEARGKIGGTYCKRMGRIVSRRSHRAEVTTCIVHISTAIHCLIIPRFPTTIATPRTKSSKASILFSHLPNRMPMNRYEEDSH
ncbi:hypothetical protein PC117_g21930 [Phytophthora cactorum]|uniref:Uncharacterized protein n=1 Tax=Phytophthora cactorum TaxID=29920 RepID=A0A8T1BII9_9STRA|nr:hypothetical protein PC117_g21930 [Phytophthora cactorum]